MEQQQKFSADTVDDDDDDAGDSMDIGSLGAFAYGLDESHYIRFRRRGPCLLVSFEPEYGASALADCPSRFDDLCEDMQWSTLTLLSRGDTWFRAPEVIQFFDALVDGTLLDQFGDVLFYGQGSGGHGALSFALTAPGARVLALAPHFGFGIAEAPQDDRFAPPSDVDFTTRYGLVPENLDAAQSVWLLYDPNTPQDRAHVTALKTAQVHLLACRNMGSDIEAGLTDLGLLEDVILRAMEDDLSLSGFYRALRARRDDPAWLRRLIARLIERERPLLEALAVRNVAERTGRQRYARRFQQIEADLRQSGIQVPPLRADRQPT